MDDIKPVIYVIDDELSVGTALRRLIHSVGLAVQTFTSAQEFLDAKLQDAPGCLVLDVRMPGMSGLEVQQRLAAAGISLPVIFLTGHADIEMTVRAMKAGAIEFLTKPFHEQELLDAIQAALRRHRIELENRMERSALQAHYDSLTSRESEVFRLVTNGLLNKQIAAELGASEKTIKVHRAQVMRKMDAGSLADLVRMAEKLQIGPLPPKSDFSRTKVR
ncbi:MAG: two-component response regulator [Candidatus Angelobacter sp.]|jgi:FixJ family two-component response regulator|nr:two-component response regulator [Candidatus Angelobacter sp.]